MATGKVNVGGGSSRLNLFTQLEEPKSKEGIWIQCDSKYSNIVNDSSVYLANQWISAETGLYPDNPVNIEWSGGCNIGTDIYYIGIRNTNDCYKFSTTTRAWTKLSPLPTSGVFTSFRVVAVEDKIYTFSTTNIYIYDTSLNTWKTLTSSVSIPNSASRVSAIGHDGYIYILFDSSFYKYNPVDNSMTKLSSPIAIINSNCQPSIVGGEIYFLAVRSATSFDKYNILNNTWTQLTSPNAMTLFGSANSNFNRAASVSSGSDIYYLGGYHNSNKFYKYDTVNQAWSYINDMQKASPSPIYVGSTDVPTFLVGSEIHSCYGIGHSVFDFNSKQYEKDNTFILYKTKDGLQGNYYTQFATTKEMTSGLLPRFLSGFDNAWLFHSGRIEEYPTYYGNGVSWIKFKN